MEPLTWRIEIRGTVKGVPFRGIRSAQVTATPQGYVAHHDNERYWVKHDPNGNPFIDLSRPVPGRETKEAA